MSVLAPSPVAVSNDKPPGREIGAETQLAFGLCECGCGQPTPLAPRTDTSKGWTKGVPLRYLRFHRPPPRGPKQQKPLEPLAARLEQRIDFGDGSGCWLWKGETNDQGYGIFNRARAHRTVYELLVGSVPEGLELDHVCHNEDGSCLGGPCDHRRCVNPAHLEAVTHRVNAQRGRTGEYQQRRAA